MPASTMTARLVARNRAMRLNTGNSSRPAQKGYVEDGIAPDHANLRPARLELKHVTDRGFSFPSIHPVSYTHLDVYKRQIALRGRSDHLLSVLQSEWSDLASRRALRRLEGQLRETERRCDALIASSRDPIAYVHEGMHIRANEAYLEMFGFDAFDDIEGLSLLDLVAPQYVAEFKVLLKNIGKGEAPPPRFELEARTQDGEKFPATLEFTSASYEGESLSLIHI